MNVEGTTAAAASYAAAGQPADRPARGRAPEASGSPDTQPEATDQGARAAPEPPPVVRDRSLRFGSDGEGHITVQVLDKATGAVVREVPRQRMLSPTEALGNPVGGHVDTAA